MQGSYAVLCKWSPTGIAFWKIRALGKKLSTRSHGDIRGVADTVCPKFSPTPQKELAITASGSILFALPNHSFAIISAFTGKELATFPAQSAVGALLGQAQSFSPPHFLFSDAWIVFKVPGDGIYCYEIPALYPWAGIPERIIGHCDADMFWEGLNGGKSFTLILAGGACAITFRAASGRAAWLSAHPFRLPYTPQSLPDGFFKTWGEGIWACNDDICLNEALADGKYDMGPCYARLCETVDRHMSIIGCTIQTRAANTKTIISGHFSFSFALSDNSTTTVLVCEFPPPIIATVPICSCEFDTVLDFASILISPIGRPGPRGHCLFVGTGACRRSKRCIVMDFNLQTRGIQCKATYALAVPQSLHLNWRGDVQSDSFYISIKK